MRDLETLIDEEVNLRRVIAEQLEGIEGSDTEESTPEVCPICAMGIVPSNKYSGAYKQGVCETCYLKALASATLEKARAIEADKGYTAARQAKARARKKQGKE